MYSIFWIFYVTIYRRFIPIRAMLWIHLGGSQCPQINLVYRVAHKNVFFFGVNFYKNKETFKIFSPQILDVYRIILVETTLESIMFYYAFSLINTMFVPCTSLLYDSTASTQTLKLSTTLLSISCGIRLISFPIMSSLSCLWIVFTNSVFQVPSQKIGKRVEILEIGWSGVIGLTQNECVPWDVTPEAFKCSVREMRQHLISWTEHLITWGITSNGTDSFRIKPITPGHPIPKISTRLFSEGVSER